MICDTATAQAAIPIFWKIEVSEQMHISGGHPGVPISSSRDAQIAASDGDDSAALRRQVLCGLLTQIR